jgi:hypothetical protein
MLFLVIYCTILIIFNKIELGRLGLELQRNPMKLHLQRSAGISSTPHRISCQQRVIEGIQGVRYTINARPNGQFR